MTFKKEFLWRVALNQQLRFYHRKAADVVNRWHTQIERERESWSHKVEIWTTPEAQGSVDFAGSCNKARITLLWTYKKLYQEQPHLSTPVKGIKFSIFLPGEYSARCIGMPPSVHDMTMLLSF